MPNTTSQLSKKLLIVSILVIVLGSFVTALWAYYIDYQSVQQALRDKIVAIASTGVTQIDGDVFDSIRSYNDYNSESYLQIAGILQSIRNANNLERDAVKALRRQGNVTNFVVTSENRNVINQEFNLWKEMNPVFNEGIVEVKADYLKDNRHYISAFAPIKNHLSDIVGILQVDLKMEQKYGSLIPFLIIPAIVSVILIIFSIILIKIILRPVQNSVDEISAHLKKMAAGDVSKKYRNLDSSYLIELTTILEKLREGLSKKQVSEDYKEKLQKQINDLLRIVSAAAEGDFTITAQVTADTLGALSDSFNLMVADLSKLVRDVKKSSDLVAQSTVGILKTTKSMAVGAENQAKEIGNVNDLAKAMAQIAENTNNSAKRASESAIHAKKVAERGGSIVEGSIDDMHKIRDIVVDTSERVKILGEDSVRIGEISGFISDIANRTNLLALNATIEAAKAGDTGRGFAVVADEIRNLAQRISNSAREITKLIDDIQNGIAEAVQAMKNGSTEVAEGTKKVDAAGSSLREILGAVDISTSSVAEITNVTSTQLRSSEEIVKVMEKIAQIATQTAEGAKQSEHETSRLDSLSRSLNDAVAKFKLSQ